MMETKYVEKGMFFKSMMAMEVLNDLLLNAACIAKKYRIITDGECYEKMSFESGDFEYEIDSFIGCYRFKYLKGGPWTRWIPVEG